jgi:hypothetical protein
VPDDLPHSLTLRPTKSYFWGWSTVFAVIAAIMLISPPGGSLTGSNPEWYWITLFVFLICAAFFARAPFMERHFLHLQYKGFTVGRVFGRPKYYRWDQISDLNRRPIQFDLNDTFLILNYLIYYISHWPLAILPGVRYPDSWGLTGFIDSVTFDVLPSTDQHPIKHLFRRLFVPNTKGFITDYGMTRQEFRSLMNRFRERALKSNFS